MTARDGGGSMMVRRMLRSLIQKLSHDAPTTLRVEFSDGSVYQSRAGSKADILIRFRSSSAEWRSLLFFYEGVLECYVNEEVDIEGDHPINALATIGHKGGYTPASFWLRMAQNPLNAVLQWLQEWRQDNGDRDRAIRNAEFHYGAPPALFEHMLGETVGYSEGLWVSGTETLNQAKFNSYEYIARKLRLQPGLKVLEVGAGWGYMPIYLTKRYGAEVTVYNPVTRQNDYMRARFERHGVGDRIRLVEGDLRDIAKEARTFDRFLSIGVHEHAGYPLKQYRLWADSIAAALKEDGIGVVSTTTRMLRQMTNRLTLKYIFPGGHLPSLPDTLTAFDRAGLTLVEVENLWPHYERTMRTWRDNFAVHWPEIQKSDPTFFTERFRRTWSMYLDASCDSFRDGLDLSHIVFTKGRNAVSFPPVDLTAGNFIGGDTQPECYR